MYIASYLLFRHPDIKIQIIDAAAEIIDEQKLISMIENSLPNILGFSVVTGTVNSIKRIISGLSPNRRPKLILAGGPHVTALPESLFPEIDICILKEGELTFSELISAYREQRDVYSIEGIAYQKDAKLIINFPRPFIKNLDELPFPARELINPQNYEHIFKYSKGLFTTVITSRGCYHDCAFCANRCLWNGTVRQRSVDNVILEITLLLEQGYSQIYIDDDNFLQDIDYAFKFCNEILRRRLNFTWMCHARIGDYPSELMHMLFLAGCKEIQVGVETLNQKTLNAINKKVKIESIFSCIDQMKRNGIYSWATFIIGLPDETPQDIKNTVLQSLKLDPTYATFIYLLPFPGTKIFDQYNHQNYIITTNYDKYTWHGHPIIHTNTICPDELKRLRRFAYLKFYLRIKPIVRFLVMLLHYRIPGSMWKNFIRFFHLGVSKQSRKLED
jgi:radical SAM superfamily enzyme YgiQ (UPF0313 family)